MSCECGCGRETGIIRNSDPSRKRIRGSHYRFIHGHNTFKGGRLCDAKGYIRVLVPEHPKSQSYGYMFEHRLIAEKVLGHPLPDKTSTHHYGRKDENEKIVLCEDYSYHQMLHRRTRAYNICGHAHWMKCPFCQQYDDPKNMYINGRHARHNICHRDYNRKHKQ